jgi:hypothetical protein
MSVKIVGNEGIRMIATGQLYPSYPLVFPNAQVKDINGERMELTLKPTVTQIMKEANPIESMKSHPYITTGVCVAGVAVTVQTPYVVAAVSVFSAFTYVLYQQYGHKTIETVRSYEPITYGLVA